MTTAQETAVNDQVLAAARHARQVVTQVAHLTGTKPVDGTHIDWLRGAVVDYFRALRARPRWCRHVGPGKPPAVLFGAVWKPGKVCCFRCSWQLEDISPIEERRCDRCGKVVDLIHSGSLAIGAMIIGYGLCRRCITEAGMPIHPDAARSTA